MPKCARISCSHKTYEKSSKERGGEEVKHHRSKEVQGQMEDEIKHVVLPVVGCQNCKYVREALKLRL